MRVKNGRQEEERKKGNVHCKGFVIETDCRASGKEVQEGCGED